MVEENIELKKKILQILAKVGSQGVTREMFYQKIHGLGYEDMMKILNKMESDGFVYLEWIDTARFYAYITEKGLEYLKAIGFLKDAPARTNKKEGVYNSIERI